VPVQLTSYQLIRLGGFAMLLSRLNQSW